MFQSKGKSGSFRARSTPPDTRTFVPENLRLGKKPKAQPVAVQKAPAERQSTQPFATEADRLARLLTVTIGESPAPVPSQARPTPLPAADTKGSKKKRESSLLGLIVPSLGKKSGSAPRPPSRASVPMDLREPTMDVSETDLSLVESSTHELEIGDLSSVADYRVPEQLRGERYVPTEPPPPPYRAKRKYNPWLLWGAVGSAWCAMIAFALFMTGGDDGLLRAEKKHSPIVVEAPAALVATAPAQEALHASAPDTAKPVGETQPSVPAQEETAVPSPTPSSNDAAKALTGDAEQLRAKKSHHQRRVHKRGVGTAS
jgi:hypothetical protein